MSLSDFALQEAPTHLGVIRLRVSAGSPTPGKPVVVGVAGMPSESETLANLLARLDIFADACIAYLPGGGGPPLSSFALGDISAALAEALERTFPGRPVVLLGSSIGAIVALGVRASNIARVVAIEPPLLTRRPWPPLDALREHLQSHRDPDWEALAWAAFGMSEGSVEDRDHREVLDGLSRPVDAILGGLSLKPQTTGAGLPSLVDEAGRRFLGSRPGLRLHLARGVGHDVLGQAAGLVLEVLLEACRRASAPDALSRSRLDEPLLEATPAMSRRVLYCGEAGDDFRSAFLAANPKAEVVVASAGGPAEGLEVQGEFDAVVSETAPSVEALASLVSRLKDRGHLVVRWAEDPQVLAPILAPHALALRAPIDDSGAAIVRAQKLPPGVASARPLVVQATAFAQLLMDIRTRLPVRQLRSDPELQVVDMSSSLTLLPLPRDCPKVLVLQRPVPTEVEVWRVVMAEAIKGGWIVVIEFDDHPLLIRKMRGLPGAEEHVSWLAFAHAVQTTTPPLVDAFTVYNPEVAMFPNAVFDLLPFPEGPRAPRVVYSGVTRGPHAVEVAASLGPAIAACPEAEFHVIGDRAFLDALPTDRKIYYDYMSYEAYLGVMAGCPISLSPIAPEPFQDAKSDAKFLDAARSGGLTIASPIIYDRVINHGGNGLLALTAADWAPLLTRVLSDQAARSAMARRAWDYVREHRMFSDQIVQRRAWYQDLWSRRRELDEAVMARVPGLRELVEA